MGSQAKNPKEETPAPGAGASSENTEAKTASQSDDVKANESETQGETKPQVPQWALDVLASNELVLKSNQEVIESNNRVLEGIDGFKGYAAEYAQNILKGVPAVTAELSAETAAPVIVPEFNAEAKYVALVKMVDANDPARTYDIGEDITHVGKDRILKLLERGSVKEA